MKQVLIWAALFALAAAAVAQGPAPIKVGEEVNILLESHASSSLADRSQIVWREEITWPGAAYIAPHFSHFHLPAGAQVIVRGPENRRSWSYTGFGKTNSYLPDGFWGIHIPGDTAIIELVSTVPVKAGAVVLDRFSWGDPDAFYQPLDRSLCGADDTDEAKCYQSSDPAAYAESRAVARLLINGGSLCTGWLVGDQGHLMTNEHCIGNASAALNTDFEFDAEGANCSVNCASSGACSGTVVATSSTSIQIDAPLDYSLVQLPVNPTGTYGFMQLRSSGPTNGERIYIPQHPAGWGKRIGIDSSHTQNPGGVCEVDSLTEPGCGSSFAEVGYFCDTQGGSSGSPVLGYSDNCVVALHHCRGNSACTGSGGDPNRGVPIDNIISDLGSNLPNNAICGGGGGPTCGNGIIETGEVCDGSNLGGATCTSQGFTGGTLACNSSCTGFDTSSCTTGGGACPDCVDFSVTGTVSFATQDAASNFTVEDGGATLALQDNTWRRTTQTYAVTANTVVEFDFLSTSQGEIHGIGLDEDNNLSSNRIFKVHGTQNYGITDFDNYVSGWTTYQIPVGQYYTGSSFFLVLVNDNDAGSGNNSRFRDVRIFENTGGGGTCTVDDDFEGGAAGWSTSGSCSTGTFVLGNPTLQTNSGVTTQVGGAASGSNALFTATNTSAGNADVDGGECVLTSPTFSVGTASNLAVNYFHGQRDAGDDPGGDYFVLEYSTNGGSTWSSFVSIGDVQNNAAWTTAGVAGVSGSVQLRVRVSDGAGPGDLVEGGIDDFSICEP